MNTKYKMQRYKNKEIFTGNISLLCFGEPMALKALNEINEKLRFLYRKNKFLTPTLRRML